MSANRFSLYAAMLCTIVALAFLGGCTRDGAEIAHPQAVADEGPAGTDEGASAADEGLEPPKNYIPLNDEACVIESKPGPVVDAAHALLTKVSADFDTRVGEGLEICGPGMKNGCPACAEGENPMGDLLAELSDKVFLYLDSVGVEIGSVTSIAEYFRVALLYPYRYIMVSWTGDEERTDVILSQGKRQGCAGGDAGCSHFSMESESLDLSCEQFSLQLVGPGATTAEGATVIEAELEEQWVDTVTFGYVVPLTDQLPEDPEKLSETELDLWLDHLANLQERLNVRLREPKVRLSVNADGSGCGTLSGRFEKEVFYVYAASENLPISFVEDIINKYTAEDDPEMIEAVLSFRLDQATVLSGIPCNRKSCDERPDPTCDGDLLKDHNSNANCSLPRPEGYTSGDAIEPVCEYGEPFPFEVDCAAAGGSCTDGACTVEWEEPQVGDLIFSEVMVRPETDRGRSCWFEVANVSDKPVDISGCVFNGSDTSLFEVWRISPTAPVVVPPGGAYVIGAIADTAENGGLEPDATHEMNLNIIGYEEGTSDYLSMHCNNELMDEISWGREANNLEFGASLQLDPEAYDRVKNDDAASWCNNAKSRYGEGGFGTPGEKNLDCP